jgi:hypothetical protein
MKILFSILAFIILIVYQTQGQIFAFEKQPINTIMTNYSKVNFVNYRGNKRVCAVTKAGQITAIVGGATAIVGLGMIIGRAFQLGNDGNDGDYIDGIRTAQVGGVLALLGGCIALGGLIHDIHESRVSLISSQKNEMGIAYSF